MQSQFGVTQIPIEIIVERIFAFRQITRLDQLLLMKTLLIQDSCNEKEQNLINEIFQGLQSGLIRVVE